MQQKFEEWVVAQFGMQYRFNLEFDDGYVHPIVNAMWIGFNAGALLGCEHDDAAVPEMRRNDA